MADNGNISNKLVTVTGFRSRPYDGPVMPRFQCSALLTEPPIRYVEPDRMKFALSRI